MPIIKPSIAFENSSVDSGGEAKYIRSDIPQIKISTKENKEGVELLYMPSYKADAAGNGVWYNQFQLRANFGTGNFKEKYYVAFGADDPVAYFERNFKMLYPDASKITKEVKEGREFKIYPPYGNLTKHVVTNNINFNKPAEGIQVVDVPSFNAFSQIDDYHKRPAFGSNSTPPLVCDPERAAVVFVKCKEKAQGNPWVFQVDLSRAVKIPEQFQDSDNLHNLDNIFIIEKKETLIEKLRSFFNGDQFDACMAGYRGLTTGAVPGVTLPAQQTTFAPAAKAPAFESASTPTANPLDGLAVKKSATAVVDRPDAAEAPIPKEEVAATSNPMAAAKPPGLDAALAFLKTKTPAA